MPSKGAAARPQPPSAPPAAATAAAPAPRKTMLKVDRLRAFDAQLGKLKACNRADFLNAWRERKAHARVSRFMGSRATRRPMSAPAMRYPDGKPIDEDAPPDSDSEDDCPPHQNARRLDALDRINNSELLHTLCTRMYETRRRHGCNVRASDWDITNGVMLLETLYILLPHLFAEPPAHTRALTERNADYDPASPPSSRPTSTNVTGIDPTLPISDACGVERNLDRNGDAARRNIDRVIEAMGRHIFYDYYGSGQRTDQLNFTAARKSDNIVWLLPKSLFTMAHHGPHRDKIMVEIDFLGDDVSAFLFDEMNQVLLKIGAQKAPAWNAKPKIVPDIEDPIDYSWLNTPAPQKSKSFRQDSIPVVPSPERIQAEENMKERKESKKTAAEVAKQTNIASKDTLEAQLDQAFKVSFDAKENSETKPVEATKKSGDERMDRTVSQPVQSRAKSEDEDGSKPARKRNTMVGPPRRVPKRVSRPQTDSTHVLDEKSGESMDAKSHSHGKVESSESSKEKVMNGGGTHADEGGREKKSRPTSARTNTSTTPERLVDKARGENGLAAPSAKDDDSSSDGFPDDDDDTELGSPEQERSVSVDGEKGSESVQLIDERLLGELQLRRQGSHDEQGPQIQAQCSRVTDAGGSSENSASPLPNLAHTFVSPSVVRARGIGQLSITSTPIGSGSGTRSRSRTLSRSSTKHSLARGSSASNLRLSAEFSRGERLSAQLAILHKQVEDERTVRAALETKIEMMEKEKVQIDLHSVKLNRLMERLTQQREEACAETKRLRLQLDRMEERARRQDDHDRQFIAMQNELKDLRAKEAQSTHERAVLRDEVASLRAMLGETNRRAPAQKPNGLGRSQTNIANSNTDGELGLGFALGAQRVRAKRSQHHHNAPSDELL